MIKNNIVKWAVALLGLIPFVDAWAAAPDFKREGRTVEELLPNGWIVNSRDTGDMNKDGVDDLLLVLQDTMEVPEPECRTFYVAVCWGSKEGKLTLFGVYSMLSGCEKSSDDDGFQSDGPYRTTSELSASINQKGAMRIFKKTQFWLASHQYMEDTYLYRFQNGDFYLIGSEHYQYGTVGISAGSGFGDSKNYLTKKAYEYDVEDFSKKKGKWTTLSNEPLVALKSILQK